MSKSKAAPEVDPLAELIMEMRDRIARSETALMQLSSMVLTLGDECGYDLKRTPQGGGKVVLSWERKSKLVRL